MANSVCPQICISFFYISISISLESVERGNPSTQEEYGGGREQKSKIQKNLKNVDYCMATSVYKGI